MTTPSELVEAQRRHADRRADSSGNLMERATEAQIELDRAKAEFFRWTCWALCFVAGSLGLLLLVHVVAIVAVVE